MATPRRRCASATIMLASAAKASPPKIPSFMQRHYGLEQLAQKIALAKTTVAVLGKRRMIGDVAIEPQATEPAIGQTEVDLLAQPAFRANAEAVADDQHPDHQLRIDRRATDVAVVRSQMRPQTGQIDEPVDLAKQVTVRDVPLKAKALEQRLLHHPPLTHHRPNLPRPGEGNPMIAAVMILQTASSSRFKSSAARENSTRPASKACRPRSNNADDVTRSDGSHRKI